MIDSTRSVVRYPRNDTTDRYGAGMDPVALIDYLRDELRRSGHPSIVRVEDLDSPGVGVHFDDKVKVFAKVAWVGRSDVTPGKPSWPSRDDLTRGGRK